MSESLAPPGADLAWVNRRILAERLHWPEGVRADCELFETLNPGWSIWWRRENTTPGFEHPAAFIATHHGRQAACGETLGELAFAMETTPLDNHGSWRNICCGR